MTPRTAILLFLALPASCLPVSLKAKCEVMAKTDYSVVVPEQKCGIVAEVEMCRMGGR
jgi:hypothetical protein